MQLNKLVQIFIIVFLVFIPFRAKATIFYLEPAAGQYNQGDTFVVSSRLDTQGECINAVEAKISFSQDVLEAVDFSQGESVLTLWTENPSIDQAAGLISFSGGIPGGYCGRLPGDPGRSDLLLKIIFKVRTKNPAEIKYLDGSLAYLNDGLGTLAGLSTRGAAFSLSAQAATVPKTDWQKELAKDKIPPEDFKIELVRDPLVFNGKYFITFLTIDKQTGIDFYQVQEGRGEWQSAKSPYLLENQLFKSIIKVKAVDKAGNERIVQYTAPRPLIVDLAITLAIITILVFGLFIKRKHDKA